MSLDDIKDEDLEMAHKSHEAVSKVKLTKWKQEPTVKDLMGDYHTSLSKHQEHTQEIINWLDALYVRGSNKKPKKKGRSSVQPKVIRKNNEWRYAALSEPFLSTDDIFNTAPATWEDREAAIQNGLVLNHQFNNEINKQKFIDDFVRTVVDEGTSIVRVGWDYVTKKVFEPRNIYEYVPTTDPQVANVLQEAAVLRDSNPNEFDRLPDEYKAALSKYEETGHINIAKVTGSETVEVEKVIVDKPTLEVCDFRNTIIDPAAKGDMNKAMFVIRSFSTSYAELKAKGIYQNLEAIDADAPEPSSDAYHEEGVRGDSEHSSYSLSDKPRKKVVAYEYWGYRDVDGSGNLTPIVATWVGNTMIELRRMPYPDGKLPFVLCHYMPIKDSNYGEPDAELLLENQKVIGSVVRGSIDIMARSANAQRGTRKGTLDAPNLAKYRRGEDYEFNGNVDATQISHMEKYEELPQSTQVMLQMMQLDAESLTGVKAFASSGITGNALGDSVGGAKSAMDAAAKREMGILRRLSYAMIEIGRKITALNAHYLDEAKVVRITNDKFVKIDKDDLQGKFDVKLSISTPEADDQKAQEIAFMLQTLGNNVDFNITKILLAENARLRKMPDLAKRIEEFEPQPDPLAVQQQQLEIQLLQAKLQNELAQSQLNGSKVGETQAKTEKLLAETDQLELNTVEQESGVQQEREKERIREQSKGNIDLRVVEAMIDSKTENKEEKKKGQ